MESIDPQFLREHSSFVGHDRTSGKKQTGPRKLQVAGKGKSAISAEKQRAALGLDKDKNEETQACNIPHTAKASFILRIK